MFPAIEVIVKSPPVLRIEQTEALVSNDVNVGSGTLGGEMSKEQAILEVNLAVARQIARELCLRDIGGVYGTVWKAINRQTNEIVSIKKMKRKRTRYIG